MPLHQLDDDILIEIVESLDDYSKVNFLLVANDKFSTLIDHYKAQPIILNYSMVYIHEYGNFNYTKIIELLEKGYRFKLNFHLDFCYHYEVAQSLASKRFGEYKLKFNRVYKVGANHQHRFVHRDFPLLYQVDIQKN